MAEDNSLHGIVKPIVVGAVAAVLATLVLDYFGYNEGGDNGKTNEFEQQDQFEQERRCHEIQNQFLELQHEKARLEEELRRQRDEVANQAAVLKRLREEHRESVNDPRVCVFRPTAQELGSRDPVVLHPDREPPGACRQELAVGCRARIVSPGNNRVAILRSCDSTITNTVSVGQTVRRSRSVHHLRRQDRSRGKRNPAAFETLADSRGSEGSESSQESID